MRSFTTVPARRHGKKFPTRRSSTKTTPSSGSTRPPSAAPTCTSWLATSPRCGPGGSSATRPWAPSTRSATACTGSRPVTASWSRASPRAAPAEYCREGRYGQCLDEGGWVLGHRIDGTQAEYVRVPYADTSTFRDPRRRSRRGDADAGRRPADRLRGRRAGRRRPAGRRGGRRRAQARSACPRSPPRGCSAPATSSRSTCPTPGWRPPATSAPTSPSTTRARTRMAVIKDLTGRLGADVAIEAVGTPATFEMAVKLARPGGRIANIGVHGERGRAAPGRAVGQGHHDHHRAWSTPRPPRP